MPLFAEGEQTSDQTDTVAIADTVFGAGDGTNQLIREGYFSSNKYFHPEEGMSRVGVVGDPVPYNVDSDYSIAGLLLFCFIVGVLSVSVSRNFLLRQLKNFFYVPRSVAEMTETTGEIRVQYALVVQTALLLAVSSYIYGRIFAGYNFVYDSWIVIGFFFIVFCGYFLLKRLLYGMVNWVFFDKKKNEQWKKTWLFLTGAEGLVLFSLLLLVIYLNIEYSILFIFGVSIVILTKILSFYKCFVIFFRQKRLFLQIFLYFCALEMMPFVALWGILQFIGNVMNVNF